MSARQTPNEFLKQIVGRPVVVKLNNGVDYRGTIKKGIHRACGLVILAGSHMLLHSFS